MERKVSYNDLRQAVLTAAALAAPHDANQRPALFVGYLGSTIGDHDIALTAALLEAVVQGDASTASALLLQAH